MALMIPCPNCGPRPFTEFWWGGEVPGVPPTDDTDVEADFARVWLRANAAGEQEERWFHYAGCRRWLSARRDTRTNTIHAGA
ncbi:MAG TPA: sarcosine oxidase subunit delta [Vicinamibacterales bacterium]|nr:sarcosine oxidase subunit delta [Vicinamibacterales bacterium]